MYQDIINNGMILVFTRRQACAIANQVKKPLKKLEYGFSLLSLRRTIAPRTYFCKSKNQAVEQNTTKPDQLRLDDILIPNAQLSAFTIELNEDTAKLIEETQQKQDEVLKLKEVNEERLRMVVQL